MNIERCMYLSTQEADHMAAVASMLTARRLSAMLPCPAIPEREDGMSTDYSVCEVCKGEGHLGYVDGKHGARERVDCTNPECVTGYLPDLTPGNYYVSVKDDGKAGLVVGPFDNHKDALLKVSETRRLAGEHNPRAVWWSFGTCRAATREPGKWNAALGL